MLENIYSLVDREKKNGDSLEIFENNGNFFENFKSFIGKNNWEEIKLNQLCYNQFIEANNYFSYYKNTNYSDKIDEIAVKLNDYLKDSFADYIQQGYRIEDFCEHIICGIPKTGDSECGDALIKKIYEIQKTI